VNVADEAYAVGWNGSTEVPTKNAVYDKIEAMQGYVLHAYTHASASADATTYYMGSTYVTSLQTTAGRHRIYIPKAGTIKKAWIMFGVNGTLGTTETSTVSIRLNDTTDTTVSSAVTLDTAFNVFSNTALSIAVVEGDYIEFKWVAPTWATNPTSVNFRGEVYIE